MGKRLERILEAGHEIRNRYGEKMSDPLKPNITVLIKLGSIAVHVEEMLSPHGHEFDKAAIETLLSDPEVKEWIKEMTALAFMPVKRNGD